MGILMGGGFDDFNLQVLHPVMLDDGGGGGGGGGGGPPFLNVTVPTTLGPAVTGLPFGA